MYRCRASRAAPRICTISTPTATAIVGRFSTLADRICAIGQSPACHAEFLGRKAQRLQLGQRRSRCGDGQDKISGAESASLLGVCCSLATARYKVPILLPTAIVGTIRRLILTNWDAST